MSRLSRRVETWQLRAKFAAALSQMYGAEVPAYTTLVEASAEVNREYAAVHPAADRFGSLDRVTAERHGAIRVGSARELAQVATCSPRSACIRSASTTCATRPRLCR